MYAKKGPVYFQFSPETNQRKRQSQNYYEPAQRTPENLADPQKFPRLQPGSHQNQVQPLPKEWLHPLANAASFSWMLAGEFRFFPQEFSC